MGRKSEGGDSALSSIGQYPTHSMALSGVSAASSGFSGPRVGLSSRARRDSESDIRIIKPVVRNGAVCEDLGAVDFVFSDKTGTLTDNVL